MISYYFRFIDDEDGKPTGWVGHAVAPNKLWMFWEIDQYGDPYRCEVISTRNGSACFVVDDDGCLSNVEAGDIPLPDDKRWKRPTWPSLDDVYAKA